MHSRALQCKEAAYIYVNLTKMGNGCRVDVHAWPHPSRSAWAENIANAWLPIQTYGITSKGHNFNSRCESNVISLVSTHCACPCKNCGMNMLCRALRLFFFPIPWNFRYARHSSWLWFERLHAGMQWAKQGATKCRSVIMEWALRLKIIGLEVAGPKEAHCYS